MLELIRSEPFHARLQAVGGYDVSEAGKSLSGVNLGELRLVWERSLSYNNFGLQRLLDPQHHLVGTVSPGALAADHPGEMSLHSQAHQTVSAFLEVGLQELHLVFADLAVQQLVQLPDEMLAIGIIHCAVPFWLLTSPLSCAKPHNDFWRAFLPR